jgi:hypothetical protein
VIRVKRWEFGIVGWVQIGCKLSHWALANGTTAGKLDESIPVPEIRDLLSLSRSD